MPSIRCLRLVAVVSSLVILGSQSSIFAVDDLPRLVRQLGSDRFDLRQQAHRQILDRWSELQLDLENYSDSSDPEVQGRLDTLRRRVRDRRYDALLSQLLANPQQPAPDGLPLWVRYSMLVSDDHEARRLYRDMLRSESVLMTLLAEESGGFADHLRERLNTYQHAIYASASSGGNDRDTQAHGRLAVLLLISIVTDGVSNSGLLDALNEQLNEHSREQLSDDVFSGAGSSREDSSKALERLLEAWVRSPHAAPRQFRMTIGLKYKLSATVAPAREMLFDNAATTAQKRDAVLSLARFGTEEQVPDLVPLLRDETVIESTRHSGRPDLEARLQDLALLALTKVTGQDPHEYGFHMLRESSETGYVLQTVGFSSDVERVKQLNKWRQWEARHFRMQNLAPVDAAAGVTL